MSDLRLGRLGEWLEMGQDRHAKMMLKTVFYAAEASLELVIQIRLDLILYSSCLYFTSSGVTGMHTLPCPAAVCTE